MKLIIFLVVFSLDAFAFTYSHYSIRAELKTESHTIEGEETVTFRNNFSYPINEILFSLPANLGREKNPYLSDISNDSGYENGFEPRYTIVTGVTSSGKPLQFNYQKGLDFFQTYSVDRGFLKVKLPARLDSGKSIKVVLKFKTGFPEAKGDEAHFQGMYIWRNGWFPVEVQIQNDRWHKGFSAAPFKYMAYIKVPEEYVLIAGGDRVVHKKNVQGKQYELSSDSFVVSVPICIAKDVEVLNTRVDGIQVKVYTRKKGWWFLDKPHRQEGLDMLSYAREILKYYNRRFGRYRFKKLEIIESTDESAGMAADGLVLMPDLFFVYKNLVSPGIMERYLEQFLAHEIAHNYWGLAVNVDFSENNWISEGMVQYMSITYLEEKYGPKGNVFTPGPIFKYTLYSYLYARGFKLSSDHRKDMIETPYRRSVLNGTDEAISKKINDVKYMEDMFTEWYRKSYLVIRAIENIIGRSALHRVLRSIYESTGGTTFTPEMLISKIKAYTGKDLRGFAKDWIFSSKTLDYAILDVKRSSAGSGHTTFITVKNHGTGTMPADLVVYDTEGKLLDHRRIEVGPELARDFEFETKKEVTRVSIDEGEYVPDLNRRNNFFPREGFGYGFIFDNYSTDRYSLTLDMHLAMKQALEVRGGYLDDHRWSILAGQRLYDRGTHFWIGRGYFSKNVGRNKYVYSRVSYDAWQKDLSKYYWGVELGIALPFFSSINIGYTGRYNIPANVVGLHISYLNYRNIIDSVDEDFDGSEIYKEEAIIGLVYSRNDMLKLGWENHLTGSYFTQSGNYKLKLSSQKYFKLTGRVLFSIFGEYGYASEEIPALYMFDLDHMNIFEYRIIGPALVHMKLNAMIKLFKTRKTRIFGRAEKYIPVLNFLVFEGVNAGAFFQASDVYTPQYAKETFKLKFAYGPELHIQQSTFFGMPLDLKISAAIPLESYTNSGWNIMMGVSMRF